MVVAAPVLGQVIDRLLVTLEKKGGGCLVTAREFGASDGRQHEIEE